MRGCGGRAKKAAGKRHLWRSTLSPFLLWISAAICQNVFALIQETRFIREAGVTDNYFLLPGLSISILAARAGRFLISRAPGTRPTKERDATSCTRTAGHFKRMNPMTGTFDEHVRSRVFLGSPKVTVANDFDQQNRPTLSDSTEIQEAVHHKRLKGRNITHCPFED